MILVVSVAYVAVESGCREPVGNASCPTPRFTIEAESAASCEEDTAVFSVLSDKTGGQQTVYSHDGRPPWTCFSYPAARYPLVTKCRRDSSSFTVRRSGPRP